MLRAGMLFIVCGIFLFSCSTSKFGWKSESESGEKKEVKREQLEDFDPLSLDDDDIVVPAAKKKVETDRLELVEPVKVQSKPEETGSETVQGFRVQLLATKDEIAAQEANRKAIFAFEQGVYLTFEAPLYRLRIGNCRTRKEAEELRDEAIRRSFRDAWIVPSKVLRQKENEYFF
ncbi:MAG: SPOR domain-containing protein [bacterium]